MKGPTVGTLKLKQVYKDENTEATIWKKNGTQGDSWVTQRIWLNKANERKDQKKVNGNFRVSYIVFRLLT